MGEDVEEFEQSRRLWIKEYQPVGHAETKLVERIAGLSWRLERAERLQNELFDFLLMEELHNSMLEFPDELTAQEEQELRSDPRTHPDLAVGRMLQRDYGHERALERLMMLERWIESSLYKSMKELRQLQLARKVAVGAGRRGRPEPGADPGQPRGVAPTNEGDSVKQSQSGNDDGSMSGTDAVKQTQSQTVAGWDLPHQEPGVSESGGASPTLHAEANPVCQTKPIDRGEAAVGAGPCARRRSRATTGGCPYARETKPICRNGDGSRGPAAMRATCGVALSRRTPLVANGLSYL